MNQGKVGAAFEYSHSYIHQLLPYSSIPFLRLDLRKIAYRTVQGITRGLSYYISRIEEMHFTHIRRRILKIRPSVRNLDLEEEEENLISQ